MTGGRRVSLVLGAGGARGYAHIGAIEVLRERGYEIAAVTGSSMGALVGGIFAGGQLEAFADWARGLQQRDVLRLVDPALRDPGVMRAERVLDRVRELVGDRRVEALAVPFTAVATDLLAGREVWLQRGPVDVAIRASIALPGIFTPVMLNGRLLADGGLTEPLPVGPAAAIPAELMVAVSLSGERGRLASVAHETAEPGRLDEWVSRFRRGAAQAFSAIGGPGVAAEVPESAASGLPVGLTALDVISYGFDAMQGVVSALRASRPTCSSRSQRTPAARWTFIAPPGWWSSAGNSPPPRSRRSKPERHQRLGRSEAVAAAERARPVVLVSRRLGLAGRGR